jgi:2-alkyl-3-oxoalkanoate reductase
LRVFVAGATGAIGRPLLPKLIETGHEVTGMTRSEDGASRLSQAGARAAICDAFDAEGVRRAVAGSGAEVVVHELTALPSTLDFRKPELWEPTHRLRREGTRILIEAAQAAGAGRMVVQSIAFAYAPSGDWVKAEDAPLAVDEPGLPGEIAGAIHDMEAAVTGAEGLDGVVLRYGQFYGPDTYYATDGATATQVRKGQFPIVGVGEGVFSFVHIDDAADATVMAVEGGAAGIYNVVDDEPAPVHEWLPVYAELLGAKPPRKVPRWLARLVAGRNAVQAATTLRGASNEKVKREVGWEPRHPSWREGFRETLT